MGVLVIFAVAIWCFSGVFSDNGTELDCSKVHHVKGKGLIACPRIMKPVCGTDDITYHNPCLLCREKLELGRDVGKKHDGECLKDFCRPYSSETQICPLIYLPHCGSDGNTYSSKCHFCSKALNSAEPLFLRHMGECMKLNE